MKKTMLVLLLMVGVAHAVTFNEADAKDLKRLNPAKEEKAILSYADSLQHARACVVNISTQKSVKVQNYNHPLFNDPFFRQFFDPRRFNIPKERINRSLGSGVLISKEGYIVTNNHVVDGADKVMVSIPGDKTDYEAKIIGTDAKSDLAVIKIEGDGFKAITLFDSDQVEVGDIVFAIGNPFGVGETVTQGIVSATNRSSMGIVEYEDFIQTDAPINPGNSGGALINSLGYLVGINSAIISKSGGNVGIGFAIPVNMVKRVTKALIEEGKFQRAYLGVTIVDVTEDVEQFYGTRYGALVMSVQKDSAADRGGLKRGDLIIAVDGKEIKDAGSLKNAVGTMSPGSKVKVEYIRDGKKKTVTVTLKNSDTIKSDGDVIEYEGLSVAPLDDETRNKYHVRGNIEGVIVVEVKEDSEAQKAGFLEGDVVLQVENYEVGGLEDFREMVKKSGKKRFFVQRRGAIFMLAL